MRPRAEELFEAFCLRNGMRAERIEAGHEKTPDYVLRCSGVVIVAEIKQFDPSPAELRVLGKDPLEVDESDVFYPGMPGGRVRLKINSAVPQLKRLSGGQLPTLLVLYDNVRLWPEICDPYAIKVAMYGIEYALVTAEPAPEGGATIIARRHGPHRKATPRTNTSLSAIALLSDEPEQIRMDVFHNFFARNPIAPAWLHGPLLTHYRLSGNPEEGFAEWLPCEVGGAT